MVAKRKPVDEGDSDRDRLVKVFLTTDEAKRIRVAAALVDKGVGEFIRDAALQESSEVLKKGFPPK